MQGLSKGTILKFIIILLLIMAMNLIGIQKVYEVNRNNQIKIETSSKLQNIMEYCKINRTDIEKSIQQLGGILSETSENYSKLVLYYDETWKQIVPAMEAAYSVELEIKTTEHTYGKLRDIILEGYEVEHYNEVQHGTKGNGKSLLLSIEGNCIIGEGDM